jgi:hypothetical protein
MSYDEHPADTPPRGFTPAVRERHHARVGVEGPKGAGKTRLAIQWARIIAGHENPVAVIDTEHRRAAAYAPSQYETASIELGRPPWDFWHHAWTGPFDPVVLVRRAEAAAEAVGPNGVIVIDSLTPFWSGRGGVQDIVDSSPSGWKVGAPVHRDMLEALSRLPCHLIVTIRSKTEHVIEEKDMGGRLVHTARRIGGAPDQRLGIDFEFEMVVTLDTDHLISVTASSCPPDFTLSSAEPSYSIDIAGAYAAWIESGIERIARSDVNKILSQFDRVDDPPERTQIKLDFIDKFGAPDDLLAEHAAAAMSWVNERVEAWLAPPEIRPTIAEPPTPAEQETLPEQPAEEEIPFVGDGLEGRDKADLLHIARTLGVEVDGRWSAPRLAAAIRENLPAEAAADAEEPVPA